MEYLFKKASIDDIDLLTSTRIEVLLAANKLPDSTDMSEVESNTRAYYLSALSNGTHTAYLVFDGDAFIGAGGVSYYQVMPTYHDQTGRRAYIMNMYTKPEYRRRGIAFHTLELLVNDAREKGISFISLEATDAGRTLYEKFGFVNADGEMVLKN